ncbi:MAG: T9SS type A sorting domain-containing protein [Bacteroidota bacterium]
MKYALKVVLLSCVALGILAAANPARQEKLREEREARKVMSTNAPASAMAPSSDWTPVNVAGLSGLTVLAIDYKANGVVWANGWVGSQDYTFYSKDGGASWSKTAMPPTSNAGYVNIAAFNDSTAVIANYDGIIFRTENRGAKWDTVYKYSNVDTAYFDGVKAVDGTTAYAIGDADWFGMHLVKTTDAGKTWSRITTIPAEVKGVVKTFSSSAYGKSIDAIGNTIWATYYQATAANRVGLPLIKSTDGGVTWTHHVSKVADAVGNVNYYFRSITFKDANNGWGVGRQSGTQGNPFHKTTDGGATWSDSIAIVPGAILATTKVRTVNLIGGSTNLMAVGTSGAKAGTWLSTDGGTSFSALVTPSTTSEFRGAGGYDLTHILVGGTGSTGMFKKQGSVEVTFIVNTSSVPDTLKSTSTVQMRGDGGASGGLLDWNGASTVRFTNIGGDYWQAKARFAPGADFPYKLYTHAQANVGAGHPGEHNGWENDINSYGNGNRKMVVGQNDTTIALQFVNGSTAQQAHFWRPYVESDSLEVTFRVNMQNQEDFNPVTQSVGVRGSFNGWGPGFTLKREANHGNGGSVAYTGPNFWSGTFKLPLKKANTDTITVPIGHAFKFVQINNATPNDVVKWEGVSDRPFTIKRGSADTTLYWKWWDDIGVKPPAGTDTAIVKFQVDMSRAISTNGYTIGDTVQVRYGFASSASLVGTKNLVKSAFSNVYSATDSSIRGVNIKADGTGKPLVYQYYIVKNGVDFRESYYNFGFTGSDVTLAERRLLPLTAKSNSAVDTTKDQTKANRWPFFRNTRKLTQNVDVKFTVNLAPAFWQVAKGDTLFGIQNTVNVTSKDSVYKWGVAINGPAAGGWNAWGQSLIDDTTRFMYDNGTHGDAVAGDRIYTRQIKFYKDSLNNVVGQEFKFGIKGGDNEGGKGGFGNNHIENINDAAATATIASQFGSINPLYYNQWNYALETKSVKQVDGAAPTQFELTQNYPNPFNPSTVINYSIPVNGMVSLKVFNVLGQEVATLVNEMQTVGNYKATFNANSLSSGVYFYKIEAGNFTSVKKMMFLK